MCPLGALQQNRGTWDAREDRKQAEVIRQLARRRLGLVGRNPICGAVRWGPGLGRSPQRFAARADLGRRRHSAARPGEPGGDSCVGLAGAGQGRSLFRLVSTLPAAAMTSATSAPMTPGNAAAAGVRPNVWCLDCRHQVEPEPAERSTGRNYRAALAQSALSAANFSSACPFGRPPPAIRSARPRAAARSPSSRPNAAGAARPDSSRRSRRDRACCRACPRARPGPDCGSPRR